VTAAPRNPLYVVATWVPRGSTLAIGSLGEVTLARGWYVYVGSARRARVARVARHLAPAKPLRWHADHLFAAAPARGAWLVDTELGECELAGALARLPGAARRPPRFGAGDCRCAGHLVRLARSPRDADLRLAAGPGASVAPFRPAWAGGTPDGSAASQRFSHFCR
jgi:Uri superfamily endonuclease